MKNTVPTLLGEFTELLIPVFCELFPKSEGMRVLPNTLYEMSTTQTRKSDKDITGKECYRPISLTCAKSSTKKIQNHIKGLYSIT
jgi:hypothetical protein